MATDATTLLGAPQLAAVKVLAKGTTTKTAVGGLLGAALASRGGRKLKSATPQFGRVGLLAATDSELALLSMKGAITLKPKDVVARVPRASVESIEVGGGALSTGVVIVFTDDTAWVLEVPKAQGGAARQMAADLGFPQS